MLSNNKEARLSGALLALTGIALGAFGAHALKTFLPPILLEVWHTAVEYQLWNAMGLIGLGGWNQIMRGPIRLITLGVLIFSGSLYGLALSGQHWLGAVTPVGGLSLLGGWSWVAWSIWRKP